jgi:aminopeptidase N
VRALQEESFWGVRAQVAGLLGKRGGRQARAGLLGALGDPHPKARRAIVSALGKLRHDDVVSALVPLAAPEGDPALSVVANAARALGTLRAPAAVAICRRLVSTPSWGGVLAQAGLDGLGSSRDPSVLPDLLAATGSDRTPAVRSAAARALGTLAKEVESIRRPAVDRLVELAQDAPFRVRLFAIKALGGAGDSRGIAVLTAIHAGDPDGRTARTAYEARAALRSGDHSGIAPGTRMQADLDALRDENRLLRNRIEVLEGRLDA